MIGSTLSHYGITEKPGQGEMAGVHRAEDMNLSRQAAIKALPEEPGGGWSGERFDNDNPGY